jgi:hypothetical protein
MKSFRSCGAIGFVVAYNSPTLILSIRTWSFLTA